MPIHSRQRGNVLFIILIAVALFAALSYAVTSSNRMGSSSISRDKAKAYAAQIIQNSTNIRQAIMRVKISNGCTDATLDFSNGVYQNTSGAPTWPTNSNAPASKVCHIFDSAGGGVTPVVPVHDAIDSSVATGSTIKRGHGQLRVSQLAGIGTDGPAGTESANDIGIIHKLLKKEVCIAINDMVGVANPSGNPPPAAGSGSGGSYTNGSLAATGISSTAPGSPVYCQDSGGGDYQYFHALVER